MARSGWAVLVSLCALIVGCTSGPSTSFEEVVEPAVLPHEIWGRADVVYSGNGPRVAILGDETIRTAAPGLRRALAGYSLKVAAIRGEGFTGGERSAVEPDAEMQRIAREYGEDGPQRVVISLGIHDLRPGKPGHQTVMDSANALFDRFDGACVVGVTNVVAPPLPDHRTVRARALNDVVRLRSDRIVDWNAMVRANPDFLSDDGVTPSEFGIAALTQSIRLAVESCV